MSSIAADPPREISVEKPKGLLGLFHAPALAAAVLSLGGVLAGPMVAQKLQNHEKSLQVRTALATDMSKSLTMAVGAGQRVASGLIYGPTGDRGGNAATLQSAYNAGLGQWQIDAGRIGAELAARYNDNAIIGQWKHYRLAVTRFYRLSAALPADERASFVARVWSYFTQMKRVPWAASAVSQNIDWGGLYTSKKFRKSERYRRAYDKASFMFLSLGDAFVGQVLKLHPDV